MLSKDPYRVSMSFNLSLQYLAGWKPVKFSLTEPFFMHYVAGSKLIFLICLPGSTRVPHPAHRKFCFAITTALLKLRKFIIMMHWSLHSRVQKHNFLILASVSISLGTKIIKRDAMNLKIFINYDHIGLFFTKSYFIFNLDCEHC